MLSRRRHRKDSLDRGVAGGPADCPCFRHHNEKPMAKAGRLPLRSVDFQPRPHHGSAAVARVSPPASQAFSPNPMLSNNRAMGIAGNHPVPMNRATPPESGWERWTQTICLLPPWHFSLDKTMAVG